MTQNKRLFSILLAVPVLLLIPFTAMQFTKEVNWDLKDFLAMGILLTGTALTIEMVLRKVKTPKYRLALCAGILIILFLVWAELAVGIFGSPFAGS